MGDLAPATVLATVTVRGAAPYKISFIKCALKHKQFFNNAIIWRTDKIFILKVLG